MKPFLLPFLPFLAVVTSDNPNLLLGHPLRDQFQLSPGYTNLNHGSYGLAPKPVLAEQDKVRSSIEANPDKFYRFDIWDAVNQARAAVAHYVGADAEDVVLLENASEGMNAILKSLVRPSTTVVYLDLAYFMVQETLRYLRDTRDVTLLQVNTDALFPVRASGDGESAFESGLVAAVEAAMDDAIAAGREIGLCTFSHVTSMPSVVLPVAALAQACKARGALAVIDGAHVLGNLPGLQVPALGADVYVSNGHKWFFTPKGAAFLWVSKALQGSTAPYAQAGEAVYPTVISNEGSGESSFAKLFSWEGTKDYGAFLSFPKALQWRATLGDTPQGGAIYEYLQKQATQGQGLLASAWGTQTLVPSRGANSTATGRLLNSMAMVELPAALDCSDPNALGALLLNNYSKTWSTWVPTVEKSGKCWVRVSAQIYNDLTDWESLAAAVSDIAAATSAAAAAAQHQQNQ